MNVSAWKLGFRGAVFALVAYLVALIFGAGPLFLWLWPASALIGVLAIGPIFFKTNGWILFGLSLMCGVVATAVAVQAGQAGIGRAIGAFFVAFGVTFMAGGLTGILVDPENHVDQLA